MKLKLLLVAAFAAVLTLTACGGGGGDSGKVPDNPAAFAKKDDTVGTGAEAVTGKTATVTYTLWLYSASAADHKGTRLESNSFSFKLGTNAVIAGFEQGVTGMKVGGKRTIEVPASLGYGDRGGNGIAPGSGLVFEILLTKVE
eukprot:TRINITY_DN13719_c0_g1_i1.p2 TRINITY_DN13719_c0_g1~~TRINITY_DN13719_c0_g1_i1.p2  ORF type:complete len:143 (+),score=39.26 TRINITY_DN13719_c0_g1_i1:181-609(+)